MPFLNELQDELDEITTLKFISAALLEASASRIASIRDAFERNAAYYDEIGIVYHIVKLSAALHKVKLKKDSAKGKVLAVAVTSNQRFYGMLNLNTMKEFVANLDNVDDLIVVGQTGIDYLNLTRFDRDFEQVVFAKDYPVESEIINLAGKMQEYTSVFVYYPKFENMLRQSVGVSNVAQAPEKGEISEDEIIKHIFEPEIDEMVDFFEKQVRVILFTRVMLEADLSRTAARLFAMSSAEDRANESIQAKKLEIGKVKRNIKNTQLLDTFAGISKWKKK